MHRHKTGQALDNARALGLAYIGVAYLVSPAVVNGDGIGYLKATFGGSHYPGHLLLVPLFSLVAALAKPYAAAPIDLLNALRWVCHVSGGIAVMAVASVVRRHGTRAQILAAVGFGGSFAVLIAAADLESYAPSLAMLCCCLWALVDDWPVLAAIFATLATLLHVENALVGLAIIAAPTRFRTRLFAALLMAVLVGGAYAIAIEIAGLGWLRQMAHGFRYPISWRLPFAALHGIGKAFVFSPYPYEATWSRVVLQSAVGVLAFLWVLLRRPGFDARERRIAIAWIIPYFLVGALYFPSDHERWIFVLPIVWWHFASALRGLSDIALVVAIWFANALVWLPVAHDDSQRRRAAEIAPLVHNGDVIISPGHGWDELVGLYESRTIDAVPLVYYAGVTDLRGELGRRTAHAKRVLLLRLDGTDTDPLGWKELAPLGYDRIKVNALFTGWRFPLAPGVELYIPKPGGTP